ncbi:MAG: ABC transporter ATP-binding protein/permease [Ndongobacter sp.]|nr:ABC transporter ATP-binding protein/permease [Ndongobacter sp.]
MFDKRLMTRMKGSGVFVALQVAAQWVSLLANIAMMYEVSRILEAVLVGADVSERVAEAALVIAIGLAVRFSAVLFGGRMSYLASRNVKQSFRESIYRKLLRLGASYHERVQSSEVVQVAVEGVEQLESYFGAYMPQLFYSILAPLTLFSVLAPINLLVAVVLFICVPLIPISIAVVQTWAKKLLSRYWGQYTALGDTFLENLQGLTTLKIYQSDERRHKEMNEEAERFRVVTMKVLQMQLNSIVIMDVVAFGGAALGMILALLEFQAGHLTLSGALLVILLSSEFFIPMRQLGSFFHIAMNGTAAADKIFHLLDLEEEPVGTIAEFPKDGTICCTNVSFAYEPDRPVLKNVSLRIDKGRFVALVGESGCGKSTLAGVLTGRLRYEGSVRIGGVELRDIDEATRMKNITYVGYNSYLFKGTVRENLAMANPKASEEQMWRVLEQASLDELVESRGGLDMELSEQAMNLSGGQRQRLAVARAILQDSAIYIFDEASSNIDVESENAVMSQIYDLARTKTVLLISHRLANGAAAEHIGVMEAGEIIEEGTQEQLLARNGYYARLWRTQKELEEVGREALA